jgi:hypothetical protein
MPQPYLTPTNSECGEFQTANLKYREYSQWLANTAKIGEYQPITKTANFFLKWYRTYY